MPDIGILNIFRLQVTMSRISTVDLNCAAGNINSKDGRGAMFVANILDRVKLEIVAADESVENIIEAIGAIARTGRKEDCRIAIRPYLEVT